MFIKFVDTDSFLCKSYSCVLFESLPHVINQESHAYSWNSGKISLVQFLKFSSWLLVLIPIIFLKRGFCSKISS